MKNKKYIRKRWKPEKQEKLEIDNLEWKNIMDVCVANLNSYSQCVTLWGLYLEHPFYYYGTAGDFNWCAIQHKNEWSVQFL